jgi:hypothetical protein
MACSRAAGRSRMAASKDSTHTRCCLRTRIKTRLANKQTNTHASEHLGDRPIDGAPPPPQHTRTILQAYPPARPHDRACSLARARKATRARGDRTHRRLTDSIRSNLIRSFPIRSYLSLSYLILSDPIRSFPIRSYPIFSDPIFSDPILSYPIRAAAGGSIGRCSSNPAGHPPLQLGCDMLSSVVCVATRL